MATFQELMDRLAEQRARASEGSPIASVLDATSKNMRLVSSAVRQLHDSVEKQVAANLAARKMGEAQDVQQTLKNMLQAKLAEDQVEHDRHQRMMDIAEKLVPQVTDEQIKAVHEQIRSYRNFNKVVDARLKNVEMRRAEANFEIQDKYGTIESALGGMANMGDSLGKFLMSGLSRYVKEKKETPAADAVKEKFDEEVFWEKENASVVAAREHISDPGSAAKLYTERDAKIKSLAGEGEAFEKQLLSGKVKVNVPGVEKAAREVAKAVSSRPKGPAELPVVSKTNLAEEYGMPEATQEATPVVEKSPAAEAKVAAPAENPSVSSTLKSPLPENKAPSAPPKNAKFVRASTQGTSAVTPSVAKPASGAGKAMASVGKFGSKAGAVNVAGAGKALAGIASKVGSLAGSAVKFLGPWGLVASAIMSFDRLVPIFSGLAGAIMDLTKLVMPLLVSTLIEGFASILGAFNGLIMLLDNAPLFGRKWTSSGSVQSALTTAREKEAEEQAKKKEAKKQAATGGVAIDTTTARGGVVVGQSVISRRTTALTTPAEADAVKAQLQSAQAAPQSFQLADWREEQREQNKAMQESVLAAAKDPGTTTIMVANPYLAPFPA